MPHRSITLGAKQGRCLPCMHFHINICEQIKRESVHKTSLNPSSLLFSFDTNPVGARHITQAQHILYFFSTYEAPASDMCCLGLHFLLQFSEVTNTMGKSGLTVKKTYSAVIRGTVMLTWSSISSRKSREGIPANSFPLTFLHQAPPLTAGPVVNMVNEVWNCCFFLKAIFLTCQKMSYALDILFFSFVLFFFLNRIPFP